MEMENPWYTTPADEKAKAEKDVDFHDCKF